MGFSLKKIGNFISTGGYGTNLSGGKMGKILGMTHTGMIPGASDSIFGGIGGANPFDPLDISGTTARRFQAEQAQADRNWQEYMSNTAHQREVADLEKAGLNPVLSATGGSGASTPGGAMAGNATGQGIGDLIGLLNAFSTIKANKTTAKQVESQNSLNSMEEANLQSEIENRSANTAQNIAESQARINKINEETRHEQVKADRASLEWAKDRPILEAEKDYNRQKVAEIGVHAKRLYEQYGEWADLIIKAFGIYRGLNVLQGLKGAGIQKITSYNQLEGEIIKMQRINQNLRGL